MHKYGGLLRASIASASNDHRLGANEAPPAIISIFLGEQLSDIFDQIAKGGAKQSKTSGVIELGVDTLPPFKADAGDRNRTSPFAFTGNRFEFRAPGSNQSIADPMIAINAMLADSLEYVADFLDKELAAGTEFHAAVQKLLEGIITEHGKVVFNGNGYSDEWQEEAASRGLLNLRTTVDAMAQLDEPEIKEQFPMAELLRESLRGEPVGDPQAGRVVGEDHPLLPELDRREDHLVDRAASVGPVRVQVAVADDRLGVGGAALDELVVLPGVHQVAHRDPGRNAASTPSGMGRPANRIATCAPIAPKPRARMPAVPIRVNNLRNTTLFSVCRRQVGEAFGGVDGVGVGDGAQGDGGADPGGRQSAGLATVARPDPADDEDGSEVLEEQRDADRQVVDGHEVGELAAGHREDPVGDDPTDVAP